MRLRSQSAAALLLVLLGVLCAPVGRAGAQGVTTAAVAGTVTGPDGQALPGAQVVVTNTSTGATVRVVSQSSGRYLVQGLQPGGPYRVSATLIGYAPFAQTVQSLALGVTRELNIGLRTEAVAIEGLTVQAERGAVLSPTRTGAAAVVSDSAITRLPTITRDFTDFTRLVPQVSTSGQGSSAGGRSNRFNSIQIDGAVNNDLFGLAGSGTPGGQAGTKPISLEAIQEFQVVLAPFDVRQGGFTGIGINAVTRSGTNDWTGSLTFFGRNQDFTGQYRFPSGDSSVTAAPVADFDQYETAFSLGGPILRDRAFFFVAGELSRRNAPMGRAVGGPGITLNPARVDSVISVLTSQYGFDPGSAADVNLRRESNNIFARLDFNLGENHRLTLRNNFVDAWDDNFATRTDAFYQLTTGGYKFDSRTNSTVGQLNSTLFGNVFNELRIGYTTIREKRNVGSERFPRVEVLLPGGCAGSTCLVTAGPENSSVANALDQDILEITNDLSFTTGRHTITVGTHNEIFRFSNLFAQNIYGLYRFASLDSLRAGRPQRYDYTFFNESTPGASRRAEFPVRAYSLYAQDRVAFGNLNVTAGLRLDLTSFPESPGDNTLFASRFDSAFTANGLQWAGRRTSQVPDNPITISPRVGFNWDVQGDGNTQLRGGVGVFQGRTPYVWISNAYGNTGLDYTSFNCQATNGPITVPDFETDPEQQSPGCRTASGGTQLPGLAPNNINTVDPDFEMPQVLRYSLAADRRLPYGLTGTLEALYTKSLNDVTYRDLTVVGTRSNAAGGDSIIEGRPMIRRVTAPGFGNVYDVSNTSENYSWSLTAQLQRAFQDGWGGSLAYTYGEAYDVNAVRSSTARSQFRYNPVRGNPNEPELARSDYDVRHRIVADLSRQFEFVRRAPTDISLIYVGESGRPYSYTYFGDVNGDSQDSNDLIYVPSSASQVQFQAGSGLTPQQSWQNLNDFIESVECLREARGTVIERNACEQPWSNRFDVRLAQTLPTVRSQGAQITVDILNFANLLNREWGRSEFINNQAETLLSRAGNGTDGRALLSPFRARTTAFQVSDLSSRYQIQVGVRYTF